MNQTPSLFSSADAIALSRRLDQAFTAWLAQRQTSTSTLRSNKALSVESAEVYQEMWNAFATFCCERMLDLPDLVEQDLETFLFIRGTGPNPKRPRKTTKNPDLSPRYARRFLTLIDWVTTHQAKSEGLQVNTAAKKLLEQPVYKYANAADKNPLPEFLNGTQAKRLIAHLTSLPQKQSDAPALKWTTVRNRTAVALMLGAGLTPGDVRQLRTYGAITTGARRADTPWRLDLPENGNFPKRQTPLAAWAGRQLAYWIKLREALEIPGDFMFPGRRNGVQWSDTRSYEAMREVLEEAGMKKEEGGGLFKLRHTFAMRQLARGKTEKEVAQWLGLLDINGMARYRRVLEGPVEVV